MADGLIIIRCGNKYPEKTTRGRKLLTQTEEGFSKWVPLKDLKERIPVELAEYAMRKKITTSQPLLGRFRSP